MTTLITGASRGIGRALFDHYAATGGRVIGTVRGPLPDQPQGAAQWAQLDVGDPGSVRKMARDLANDPVDLLICNAGVALDKRNSVDDGYPAEMWAETFAVNVTGVFLTIQALLPHLRRGTAPKIAIISSQMASDTRASGGSLIYRASKAAALNLGRNLAAELRADGIAVGIYHPGWVRTDMGGMRGDIEPADSATGLAARFEALTLDTTGCFERWDGGALQF
ncbi:MAG: SDR family oxidoreductase [Paracoccaceae bacterium]